MYVRENGQDVLKDDVLDAFARHARDGAVIVSSSHPIPPADEDGKNPPHRKAADRYREIVDAGNFICTMEWPSEENPSPVMFGVDATGAGILRGDVVELSARAAVEKPPPDRAVGSPQWRQRRRRPGSLAAARSAGTAPVTDTRTGPERVQDAAAASRGTQPPAATVGFGSD